MAEQAADTSTNEIVSTPGARTLSADLGHLGWVVRDVLGHFKLASLAVLGLNIAGTATGAAAIGALVLYARYLESGAPVHIVGLTIQPSRTTAGVIGFSAVMVLLGLCSAACLYATQWLVGRMTVRYWRMCIQRLVNIAADPAYAGWGAMMSGRPHRVLYELSGRTARMAAMVMRRMVLLILPLIVFIIASTALVSVSPLLTGLLLPLMLVYLFALYRIMRGVTRHQTLFLESNREARGGLRDAIRAITGPTVSVERKLELAAQSVQTPERDLTDDLFSRRRLADDRVHLLNTTFFVLCVQVLFVFFAIEAGRDGHSWSELLLFIVALRFAVTELRRVAVGLVFISRLLPLIVPYYEFIRNAEGLKADNVKRAGAAQALPDAITIHCDGEPMWDSATSMSVQRGSLLWVLQPWRATHSDLEAIVRQLQRASTESADMLSRSVVFAGADRESAASPQTNGVASAPKADAWAEFTARNGVHDVRVISAIELKGMDERLVKDLFVGSASGYSLLVARNPRLALDPSYKLVRDRVAGAVVMRDGRVLACGDLAWLRAHLNPIRAALAMNATVGNDDDAELDDDGDGDDEMDF